MPMPKNIKQTRSIVGAIRNYHKPLKIFFTRLRPINALFKQGVEFVFTQEVETIVCQILHKLATPPILVCPDWDAVADKQLPPPFRLYCDASIDDFGATFEQEQSDGPVRPIVFINRTALDSETRATVEVKLLSKNVSE